MVFNSSEVMDRRQSATSIGRNDERILVLAPTGRDATLVCAFLVEAGYRVKACEDMSELCNELDEPAGVALISGDVLTGQPLRQFTQTLSQQPEWSDLPVLVLSTGESPDYDRRMQWVLEVVRNATLIDRPARMINLKSAIETALRARRRQYNLRAHIAKWELRAREARAGLEYVVASISEGFMLLDHSWRVASLNKAAAELAGYKRKDMFGRNLWEIFPEEIGGKFYHELHNVMEHGAPAQFDYFCQKRQRWLEYRVCRRPQGIIVIESAITAKTHTKDSVESSVVTDNEQQHITIASSESERRYRQIMEFHPEAAFVCLEGKIVYANAACLKLLGATEIHQVVGSAMLDWIKPEFYPAMEERFEVSLRSQETVPALEGEFVTLDGSGVEIEAFIRPILWDGNNALQMVLRDIGVRNQIKMELDIYKNNLVNMQAMTHIGIWEWDIGRNSIHWSDEVYRIFDSEPQSFPVTYPEIIQQVVSLEDRESLKQAIQATLERHVPLDVEFRVQGEGELKILHIKAKITSCEDGQLGYMHGTVQDVTDFRRIENALRMSEAHFHVVMQGASVMVSEHDRELRYMSIHNPIQGIPADQIVGRRDSELMGRYDEGLALESFKRQVLETNTESQRTFCLHFSGEERYYNFRAEPLRDSEGNAIGVLCSTTNVTEFTHLQQQVLYQSEKLAHVDQYKNEIVTMWAHELRDSLASIHNAMHVLKIQPDIVDTNQVKWALYVIGRQVRRVTNTIDNFVDMSRVISGSLTLKKQVIDLSDLLSQIMETDEFLLNTQQNNLKVISPSEPLKIWADPARVTQIFTNLMNIASRYIEDRTIEMRAGQFANTAVIIIKSMVDDLSDKAFTHISEIRHKQVGYWNARDQLNLDIGFTLAGRLAELHGGEVQVENSKYGDTFTVRLPLQSQNPSNQEEAYSFDDALKDPGRRILVVDDNKKMAQSLMILLELLGHTVHTAHDGFAAIQALRDFMPEVVFLDIDMPDMNGFETARRIRMEYPNNAITLIALTGHEQKGVDDQALAAMFDAHLLKSASVERIKKLLENPDETN